MRPIRVISLVRHANRRAAFARRNAHLPFTFFDAIDGRALTAADVEASGAFSPEVRATYDAHAYGCALSHWHLWKEAAAGTEPLTIAEDDAIFRHDFEARAEEVLQSLPTGWDMVLWGWNFDSVLVVQPKGILSPVAMVFSQQQLRGSIESFQPAQAPVQPFKLESAFGLPAYTLSPQGAARMLELCFPQKPFSLLVPVSKHHVANIGVDVAACAAYGRADCFACFPPLVVTPNARGEAPGT
jgi:GR25 family glycosyltransferase involved in LPS biosynthesis